MNECMHAYASSLLPSDRFVIHWCYEILLKCAIVKIFMNECVGKAQKRRWNVFMLIKCWISISPSQLLTRRDLWNSSLIHNVSLFNLILSLMLLCFLLLQRKCVSVYNMWASEWLNTLFVCECAMHMRIHLLNWIFIKMNMRTAHIDESEQWTLTLICEDRKSIEHKTTTKLKLSQPDTTERFKRKENYVGQRSFRPDSKSISFTCKTPISVV